MKQLTILIVSIIALLWIVVTIREKTGTILGAKRVEEVEDVNKNVISFPSKIANNHGQNLVEVSYEDVEKWILANKGKKIFCIEGTGRGAYGKNQTFFILYEDRELK